MSKITITRRTRKIGWGLNASPTPWEHGLYVEKPTRPDFEGTLKQVFDYINNDPFYKSLQTGTYHSTAFFVDGQRIDTNSEAWQYELVRLLSGEIDSLDIPLRQNETVAISRAAKAPPLRDGEKEIKMTFGQFVRQLREQHNLSQDAVAQALGYAHRAQVNRMENDERPWRLESIQRLAQLFDMPASELLREFENQ